jgi:glutathione S-transferase
MSDLQKSFILTYKYVADMESRQAPFAKPHGSHVLAYIPKGILTGGPTKNPFDGAIIIWRCPSRDIVENFVREDPFFTEGLIQEYIIRQQDPALGSITPTLKFGPQGSIRLHYFNVRNRAEYIRWILAHNQIQYEDYRVPMEDWPRLKSTYEFGALPVLEIDNLTLSTSVGVGRYLATKYGQYPTDPDGIYLTEALADYIDDFKALYGKTIIMEKDPERWDAWTKGEGMQKLGLIDQKLKLNGVGSGFFLGTSLSMLDFIVAHFLYDHYFLPGQESRAQELKRQYPVLHRFVENFLAATPLVAFYISSRPQSLA